MKIMNQHDEGIHCNDSRAINQKRTDSGLERSAYVRARERERERSVNDAA